MFSQVEMTTKSNNGILWKEDASLQPSSMKNRERPKRIKLVLWVDIQSLSLPELSPLVPMDISPSVLMMARLLLEIFQISLPLSKSFKTMVNGLKQWNIVLMVNIFVLDHTILISIFTRLPIIPCLANALNIMLQSLQSTGVWTVPISSLFAMLMRFCTSKCQMVTRTRAVNQIPQEPTGLRVTPNLVGSSMVSSQKAPMVLTSTESILVKIKA